VLVVAAELLVMGLGVGDELGVVAKLVRVVAGELDDGRVPSHPAAPIINTAPTTKNRNPCIR
jgi:hypothetical protein